MRQPSSVIRVHSVALVCFALTLAIEGSTAHAQETDIAIGNVHTCAIANGWVKCWGEGAKGALGLGDKTVRGDNAGEMGGALPSVSLGTQVIVSSIAAGGDHNCAILPDGVLKCWGNNNGGQLGLGDTLARGDNAGEMGDKLPAVQLGVNRRAVRVAAGQVHTCAILDDGSVKCWGTATDGELGLGSTTTRGDGAGEMGNALPTVDLGTDGLGHQRKALRITAGVLHTCALLDNKTVKCWGGNALGQLGQGNTTTIGVKTGQMGDALKSINLGQTAVAISAGGFFTCALLLDNSVKCWGTNSAGQLGIGSTAAIGDDTKDKFTAVNLGLSGQTVVAIAAGYDHACALLQDSTTYKLVAMKCWGGNGNGQLGLGDMRARGTVLSDLGTALKAVNLGTGRTPVSIAAGNKSTCAILDNGRTKCWGANGSGRLGLGDTSARGDAVNEMGDQLPLVAIRCSTALAAYPNFCKEWIPWAGRVFNEPKLPDAPAVTLTVLPPSDPNNWNDPNLAALKTAMATPGPKKIVFNGTFGVVDLPCNNCEIEIPAGSSIAAWYAGGGGLLKTTREPWHSSQVRVRGPGFLGAIAFEYNPDDPNTTDYSDNSISHDIVVDGVQMMPNLTIPDHDDGFQLFTWGSANRLMFLNMVALTPLRNDVDNQGNPRIVGNGWEVNHMTDLGIFNSTVATNPEEGNANDWIYRDSDRTRMIIADSYFRAYPQQQALYRQGGGEGAKSSGVYFRNDVFVKGDGLIFKDEQAADDAHPSPVFSTDESYADHNTFVIGGPLTSYAVTYPGKTKKWIITNTDWRATNSTFVNATVLSAYEAGCVADPDVTKRAVCQYKVGNTYEYNADLNSLVPAWPNRTSPLTGKTLNGNPYDSKVLR